MWVFDNLIGTNGNDMSRTYSSLHLFLIPIKLTRAPDTIVMRNHDHNLKIKVIEYKHTL
jgi:hypothetical protein